MKNKFILFLIFFSFAFVFTGYSQSVVNHDDFSITFPIEPKQSEQDVPTEAGNFKMYAYMTDGVDAIYMLSYIDYPQSYVDGYTTETFFQNAMSGFTNSLGITVVEQKNISKSGYSGHYYKATGGSYYCIKYDYIVNNRFYQLGILRMDRYPTNYEISSYIDSFNLKTTQTNNNNTDEIQRPEPIPE